MQDSIVVTGKMAISSWKPPKKIIYFKVYQIQFGIILKMQNHLGLITIGLYEIGIKSS